MRPRVPADAGGVSEAGRLQEELDALSPELRHYVQEENWRLEREAEEWDEEPSCSVPPAEPSPAAGPQELSSESGPGNAAVKPGMGRNTPKDKKHQGVGALQKSVCAREKLLLEQRRRLRPGKPKAVLPLVPMPPHSLVTRNAIRHSFNHTGLISSCSWALFSLISTSGSGRGAVLWSRNTGRGEQRCLPLWDEQQPSSPVQTSVREQERRRCPGLCSLTRCDPCVPTDVLPGCERSVHSLSSEHARMAAEQTAQAIANTADAYERDGVEAALCEVRAAPRSRRVFTCVQPPHLRLLRFCAALRHGWLGHLSLSCALPWFLLLLLFCFGCSRRR